jgi:hypothetical protein
VFGGKATADGKASHRAGVHALDALVTPAHGQGSGCGVDRPGSRITALTIGDESAIDDTPTRGHERRAHRYAARSAERQRGESTL